MSSRVLLIEDEDITVKYFKMIMERNGIEVDHYGSLDELRKHYGDLNEYKTIFVDLRLNRDGWSCSGEDILREMLEITDMPIYVIWTAYGDCPEAQRCLEYGATLVVRKDGDMEKLTSLVTHIEKTYVP